MFKFIVTLLFCSIIPFTVLAATDVNIDTDKDGVIDTEDNCPVTPNGPAQGTCYNLYRVQGLAIPCKVDTDCKYKGVNQWWYWCDNEQLVMSKPGVGAVCEDLPDYDGDGKLNEQDNCKVTPNPLQQDVDADGIGDVCDKDTLYGYITGMQNPLNVRVEVVIPIKETKPDATGYYAIGGLIPNSYKVLPWEIGKVDCVPSPNPPIPTQRNA